MIGIEFDIGEFGFGDFDEIQELARQQEIPEYFVEFILAYTGISRDMADIGFSVFLCAPMLPADYVPSGIYPIWGHGRATVNISKTCM